MFSQLRLARYPFVLQGASAFDCALDCGAGSGCSFDLGGGAAFDPPGGGRAKRAGGVLSDSLRPENDFGQKCFHAERRPGASRPPVSFLVAAPLSFL